MVKKLNMLLSNQITRNLLVGSFSIAGIILVAYGTVWGAALTDDSYHYISSARNFLIGRGFDLTSHFAPVLPLVLSFIGLFNIDPLVAVRWFNAMLFGVNIFLIASLVHSMTHSAVFSILAALIASILSTLIVVHSWAMTEALYISFNLLGLLVISNNHNRESNGAPPLSGMFLGLAAATRYIGISLLLGGGIYWLTEAGKSFKERVRNALLFSLVGILPLQAWIIRNQLVTGRPTSRVIAWHPISKELWIKASNTILLWLAPGRFVHDKETLWLVVLSLALVVWLVMIMYRQRVGIAYFLISFYRSKPAFAIGMSLLSYWAILLVSRTYFDQAIPMDERLLSPVLVMGFVLLIWLFSTVWRRGYWLERTAIVAVILVLFITNLTRSAQTVHSYHQLGRGYASARDHISETYAYLRKHPTVPVYSNAAAAVYFWTDRVTYSIPARNDIPAMKEDMRKTGAFLVVFYSIPLELYGTTEAELTQGLVEQIQLSEATIYRSP